MLVPRLPQELIDEVIDAVAAGHRPTVTLRSCALTSKSWYPRARVHLFSTVTVTGLSAMMPIRCLVHEPASVKVGSKPLPQAGTLVRHLRLGAPCSYLEECFNLIDIEHIPSDKMPNLRTLSIANISQSSLEYEGYNPAMRYLQQRFRKIKKLYLHHGFVSSETLAGLLSGFPELSSLQLAYEDEPRDPLGIRLSDDNPPPIRLPLSVTDLGLGVPELSLVEWLVLHDGLQLNQLRSLSILFQPQDDIRTVELMLRHCGRTLTRLVLGYAAPPYILPIGMQEQPLGRGVFAQSLSYVIDTSPLKHNTVLEVLRIEGCELVDRANPTRRDLHSWIPTVLRRVNSQRVEEIIFAFRAIRVTDPPTLSWMDWAAIAALLSAIASNKLCRVLIEVEESEVPRDKLYQIIAALLPVVAQRDALQVRCIRELPQHEWDTSNPQELQYHALLDCMKDPVSLYHDREWSVQGWDSE